MTSVELRRLVEVLTPEIIEQVRHDLEFDAHRKDTIAAITALVCHADLLVGLVETCERNTAVLKLFAHRNRARYGTTVAAVESILAALAKIQP